MIEDSLDRQQREAALYVTHLKKAGGTAINMTIFDLLCLSVDLDLILLRICPWRI